MKKIRHWGSTAAFVCGLSYFLGGLAAAGNGEVRVPFDGRIDVGPLMVFAPLAYRFRKRRLAGQVRNGVLRRVFEVSFLVVGVLPLAFLVFLNPVLFRFAVRENPVPYLVIPIWALTAYFLCGDPAPPSHAARACRRWSFGRAASASQVVIF